MKTTADTEGGTPVIEDYIRGIHQSPLAPWALRAPWHVTGRAADVVRQLLTEISTGSYVLEGDVAVHRDAQVEAGAVLKGPLIVSRGCFVAAGAYLRGGCWLGEGCSLGSGVELKASFVFPGSRLAHFNFVGESWVGENVNLEAGSIICNHRNEREDKEVRVMQATRLTRTGVDKFGALLGDDCRIGANAVLAPGTLLLPSTVVARGAVIDQDPAG